MIGTRHADRQGWRDGLKLVAEIQITHHLAGQQIDRVRQAKGAGQLNCARTCCSSCCAAADRHRIGIEGEDRLRQPVGVHPRIGLTGIDHVVDFIIPIDDPVTAAGQHGPELIEAQPAADGGAGNLLGDGGQAGHKGRGLAGAAHGGEATGGIGSLDHNARSEEGQSFQFPLGEAGDAIGGGVVVDGATGEAAAVASVASPDRTDGDHIRIHPGIGEARGALESVEPIAGRCADQNVLGGDGCQFITEAVMGGEI